MQLKCLSSSFQFYDLNPTSKLRGMGNGLDLQNPRKEVHHVFELSH